MLTYCVLHRECKGCVEGMRYTARFYSEQVDKSVPFTTLPQYIGSCYLKILETNCHVSLMEFSKDNTFELWHQLDLWLRLVEEVPTVNTVSWERHKGDVEVVKRTLPLTPRILYLTRRLSNATSTTTTT